MILRVAQVLCESCGRYEYLGNGFEVLVFSVQTLCPVDGDESGSLVDARLAT